MEIPVDKQKEGVVMKHSRILMLLFFSLALCAWSQDPSRTHFTPFDAPGAGTAAGQGTISEVINQTGWVIGYFIDAGNVAHGFLRSPDGRFTEFDPPGSYGTYPAGVNLELAIVGSYYDANYTEHGFERFPDGRITTFDAPGAGTLPGIGTIEYSINDWGVVSGFYIDNNIVIHAFIRTPGGEYTEFEAPGAGTQPGGGTAVNGGGGLTDFGYISGGVGDSNGVSHGFLRSPEGTFTEFEAPDAGSASFSGQGTNSSTVNLFNWITGWYTDAASINHGFVRSPDGTLTEFSAPGAGTNPGQGTWGVTNNDENAVTGFYLDTNGVNHGYLRTPAGKLIEFDAPGAGSAPTGGTTGSPVIGALPGEGTLSFFINDAGVITGYFVDPNDVSHGFLLYFENDGL
jgi:hypothetical protein